MVTAETNVQRYEFMPTVKAYGFMFPFLDRADIRVVVTDADGNDEDLVQDTDYTVSFPGDSGTVTLLGDIRQKDWAKLTIVREMQLVQETDLENGQSLDAEVVEDGLDRLTMLVQQVQEQVSRAVSVSVSDGAAPPEISIPGKDERKDTFLGFDSTGEKMTVFPQSDFLAIRDEAFAAVEKANEVVEQLEAAESDLQEAVEFVEGHTYKGFETVIGDGVSTTYTVDHGLGTTKIHLSLWSMTEDDLPIYYASKDTAKPNEVVITFETPPPANSIEVIVSSLMSVEREEEVTTDDMAEATELTGEEVLNILNSSVVDD